MNSSFQWFAFEDPYGGFYPPSSASYWRSAAAQGRQRRVRTDIRVVGRTSGPLYTFDVASIACLAELEDETFDDALVACRSPNSPEAQLFMPCGFENQQCCTAYDVPAADACSPMHYCQAPQDRCQSYWDDASNLPDSKLREVGHDMAQLAEYSYGYFTGALPAPVGPLPNSHFDFTQTAYFSHTAHGIDITMDAVIVEGVNDRVRIVSLAGTDSFGDAILDAAATQTEADGTVYHGGFYEYAATLWQRVRDEIAGSCADDPDRPVWFVGHSLGGAAAQIMAYKAERAGCHVGGVMTFGGPRPGTGEFRDDYAAINQGRLHNRTHRFVNENDPVVCLAPGTIWEHVGAHMHFMYGGGYVDFDSNIEECGNPDSFYGWVLTFVDYFGAPVIGIGTEAAAWLDGVLSDTGVCDDLGLGERILDCVLFGCSRQLTCAASDVINEAFAFSDNFNRLLPRLAEMLYFAIDGAHSTDAYVERLQ